jgi:hypothetical protein
MSFLSKWIGGRGCGPIEAVQVLSDERLLPSGAVTATDLRSTRSRRRNEEASHEHQIEDS